MTHVEIRQELDARRLETLSEEAREAADEAGELDGNNHYLDLSAATWDDVAYALVEEGRLVRELEASDDPEADQQRIYDERHDDEEREALWHLEVGVAAAVMTLNVLGAHTALSCNGGAFGGVHPRDRPSVRFYPLDAPVDRLLALARDSGVGLIEEEGKALLYGGTVQDLHRFASLALQRYGSASYP